MLVPIISQASDYEHFFRRPIYNIRPVEYGGDPQVWALTTDGKGHTFLAANTKLAVWNGYEWSAYPIDGISVIRDLVYDSGSDGLLCAGDNLFGYWENNGQGGLRFVNLYEGANIYYNETFWRILPAGNGRLYVQSHEKLYLYDSGQMKELAGGYVGYLLPTEDKVLVQLNDALYEIEDENLSQVSPKLDDRIVYAEERDGSLLVIGEFSGFKEISQDGSIRSVFEDSSRMLSRLRIFSAGKMQDGSYLIGTSGDGAYIVSPEGEISESLNMRNGLAYSTALSVAEDELGNILIGMDGGMAMLLKNHHERIYNSMAARMGNVYSAAIWDGRLYFGTNKGLYYSQSAEDEPDLVPGSQGQVWDFVKAGSFQYTMADGGLYLLGKDGSYSLHIPYIRYLHPFTDNSGLYIGSDNKGLCVLEIGTDGRLAVRNRIADYDFPESDFIIDKYGYAWLSGLKGYVRRLSFDAGKTRVSENRIFRVGAEGAPAAVAYLVDGDALFTLGSDCYCYLPERDSVMASSYYTGLFSHFGSSYLNLFQSGNHFFNYIGSTVDVMVRSSAPSLRRDIFSSSDFEQLPERYRRVFMLGGELVACGFSESLSVMDLGDITPAGTPVVTVERISYVKENTLRLLNTVGSLIIPHGAQNIAFRICSYPHESLDFRLDKEDWHSVPEKSPISFAYLKSGSHILELRHGSDNVLSIPFRIRAILLLRWWFILLEAWLLCSVALAIVRFYNRRMQSTLAKYEARQKELSEKEHIAHQNEILSMEIKERDKKLSLLTLSDINTNNMLDDILSELDKTAQGKGLKTELAPLRRTVERYRRGSGTWNTFEQYLNSIFDGFFDRLSAQYPGLTNNDKKICAYIKLGMNTKEIASMMNIETSSAESARYRLRKNMGLKQDESLNDIIFKI